MIAQRTASNASPHHALLSVVPKLDNDLLAVKVSGELDMATAAVLEDSMRPFRGMHTSVKYDLTDLTFIDCAGLRSLLAPANGDPFSGLTSMTDASRCVRRLLEILQLQSLIEPLSPAPTSRDSIKA